MQKFDLTPEQVEMLLAAVITDEKLDMQARNMVDLLDGVYSGNHDREPGTIRVSDAGNCVRAVWAQAHGLEDIPRDVKGQTAMANGTGFGAYLACVLKVGIEMFMPDYRVELEYFCDDEIPGHVDAIVMAREGREFEKWVDAIFEFKWTKWPPKGGNCKHYWKKQSGKYAQYVFAPLHYVVAYVATSREVNPFIAWRFETAATMFDVAEEYKRLQAATLPERPAPDVDEDELFRCESCRYSGCPNNENPLHPRRDPGNIISLLEQSLREARNDSAGV